MKLWFTNILCGVVAAAVIAGASAQAQQTPRTLIVAAPQTPTGFDGDIPKVATRQMITQGNKSLVRYKRAAQADGRTALDPSQIEPNLAQSWDVLDGGRTYVFKLRQGVKSAWGNEMTADDIIWSFERAWQIKRTAFFLYNLIGVEKFEKTGPYEVKVTLKAPSAIFLPMLTMYFPTLHDKTQVLKNATPEDPWGLKYIDQNLVGFGAYTVEQIKPGEQVVLRANPNYYLGPPYYERIIYREVPSASNRIALLVPGSIEAFTPPPRDVAKAKALLAEAGFPNGLEIPYFYAGTYWWMEPVGIQLKNQLSEAGITLNMTRLPDPEFVKRGLVQNRDMALFPAGDATFVLDPTFTAWIFGSSKGVANRNAFSNDKFDQLISASLNEMDAAKRSANMAEAQKIHAADANWLMLSYPGVHQAMAKCVTGWIWHTDDWPRFAELSCRQ